MEPMADEKAVNGELFIRDPKRILKAAETVPPEVPGKCRVVAMNGSIRKGYGWIHQPIADHHPSTEHNVMLDQHSNPGYNCSKMNHFDTMRNSNT